MAERTLLIGVSARIHYPGEVPLGGVWTKTLHYLEQSVAHWVLSGGAMAVMVPAVDEQSIVLRSDLRLHDYAAALDGLVLQGGNDVAPETYGESPLSADWHGDRVRDRYEIELIQAFVAAGKPVFGICRGFQEINVALGGTLRRDTSRSNDLIRHHAPDDTAFAAMFDHHHDVALVPNGILANAFGRATLAVNSVHFQGVGTLAPGLAVEAMAPDGLVEAFSARVGHSDVLAVQWHPEWDAATNSDSQRYFQLLGHALRGEANH